MTIPDGYVEATLEDATHREFNGEAVMIRDNTFAFVQNLVSEGATLLKKKPEPQVFEGTVRPDELGRWVRVPADMDAGSPVTVLPGKPEEWVCVKRSDVMYDETVSDGSLFHPAQSGPRHQIGGSRVIIVKRAE